MGAFRQQRANRREVLALVAGSVVGALAAAGSRPALAAEAASPWSVASHSALRLVDGGRSAGGALLAGLALRLKPGFKTYWRHPGDSGVPPVIRFEGSVNVKEAEVLFPAPTRFDDGAGGFSFGYGAEEVLLPVAVTPADPARPVELHLQADYAVCEKLCVPASGSAALTLSGRPTTHDAALRKALSSVPKRVALATPGPLSILGLSRGGQPRRFEVAVVHQAGARPELFVEAPQPWFFAVGPLEAAAEGRPARFAVEALERAPDGASPILRLTLVAGRDAIEVAAPLDTGLIAP
jgi:DsbC/DsbD-like thiol-disulfide interchange protein